MRPLFFSKGVPNVRVRGFRFREAKANQGSVFLTVTGHCPGVVLDELDLQADGIIHGIVLSIVGNEIHEPPLVVRRSTFRVQGDGFVVSGPATSVAAPVSSSGVLVQENRVTGALRGILLQGTVVRTQVSGNLELYPGSLASPEPGFCFRIDVIQQQYRVR